MDATGERLDCVRQWQTTDEVVVGLCRLGLAVGMPLSLVELHVTKKKKKVMRLMMMKTWLSTTSNNNNNNNSKSG